MRITATVSDGGKTGMVATMFGMPDTSGDYALLQNVISPEKLNNVSESYHTSMQMLNQAYNSEETMRVAKNVLAFHGSLFNPNVLSYMNVNTITKPNSIMSNIIYSHPEVMRLDALGVINGFAEAKPDIDLHKFIYEGDVMTKGDMGLYTEYYDTEYSEIYSEQVKDIIKHAWNLVSSLLDSKLDPTDKELRPF